LPPWNKQETADITYEDAQGTLTEFFIDKGYLKSDAWKGKKPNYFIEVKTTTRQCSMPLFMSKGQYRMVRRRLIRQNGVSFDKADNAHSQMQKFSNGESGRDNQKSIYVIFRVYWLGQDKMRLRIYMDPEVLRAKGELFFQEETWSVTPSSG
jgi:hypothetical protein